MHNSTWAPNTMQSSRKNSIILSIPDTNDNTAARCKVGLEIFKLSNMGRQALTSHASGKSQKLVAPWYSGYHYCTA